MTTEPQPYNPTGRESFWLSVGAAFFSGFGFGLGTATLLIRGVLGV